MLDTFDIWDLFIGIFGLLTSIPIIARYIYGQLPKQKLDTLLLLWRRRILSFTGVLRRVS